MATSRRLFRVSEEIRSLIAQELTRMSDPRLDLVTISNVSVSPDLRNAKVYWSVFGSEEKREEVQRALDGAEGFFKRLINSTLGLRISPAIRFYYDDTYDTQDQVNKLLSGIKTKATE